MLSDLEMRSPVDDILFLDIYTEEYQDLMYENFDYLDFQLGLLDD